ncbi:MAG: hypothetical protein KJ046_07135 [Anaerolineae bacterium]|nr:hypothetical protein [Anaerolineae bacterium]
MSSQLSMGGENGSTRRFPTRPLFFVFAFVIMAAAIFAWAVPARSSTLPTISITSVVTDQTVTVQAHDFPANQNFVVTMGPFGTQGINGIVVATTNSGAGGSFSATYNIPDQLKGSAQIAIRLQTSHAYPYYAYNWFWNNTTGSGAPGGTPGYSGVPTFSIVSVEAGKTVTIQTGNFPANQVFTVTMGPMGTQGVNGIVVGTLNSGAGGALKATFNIPAQLASAYQIAIRAQTAHAAPYYAYNWFYNNTTGAGTGGQPQPTPGPVYAGTPTFTVCGVVQNTSVTIRTKDFPPNQTFQITMGPFGTQGIGGYQVGTLNSGAGGQLTATYPIPAQLAGLGRIAIRAQTPQASPFFAYNWFYNNTATVC